MTGNEKILEKGVDVCIM